MFFGRSTRFTMASVMMGSLPSFSAAAAAKPFSSHTSSNSSQAEISARNSSSGMISPNLP